MIGRMFVVAALLAASASIPAQAQLASSRGSDYTSKKVCKVEGRVGSRLGGVRTCKSQSEWDALARENRMVAEAIQRSARPCLGGSNDPTNPMVGVPRCGGEGP